MCVINVRAKITPIPARRLLENRSICDHAYNRYLIAFRSRYQFYDFSFAFLHTLNHAESFQNVYSINGFVIGTHKNGNASFLF